MRGALRGPAPREVGRVVTGQQRASRGKRARAAIRRDPLAAVAVILLVCVLAASLAAPLIAPADPYAVNNAVRLAPPGTNGFLLGSDELGRDILSRLLWGGRVSLAVAMTPIAFALVVGSVLGLVSGYFGGPVDGLIMRSLDVVLSFPYILLAIAIAATLGPGLGNAMFALTVVVVPVFARLMRATVLSIRHQEFITAARATGASALRIMWRHVFPNTVSVLIVYGTLQTGTMVIAAASLSFLGIGTQQPEADWGGMLATGRAYLREAPHVATIPGLAIFASTLAFNIAGEALRDRLDPRMRGR